MRSETETSSASGICFSERHEQLEHLLLDRRDELLALAREEDPAVIARRLGEDFDLYQYACPDSGRIDVRSLCIVREQLGYCAPLADAIFAVQGLGTYPLTQVGDNNLASQLSPFRQGHAVAGFALTEPDAGSDAAALATVATARADGYELSGDKTLISNLGIATHYLVFATCDPTAGKKAITAFWVPSDVPGLTETAMAVAGDHPIGHLKLRGVKVPRDSRVGAEGQGFELAMTTLSRFRIAVGAAALGMARRARDEATKHVQNRVQFGRKLAEQDLVRAILADMHVDIEASRLLVFRAATAADQDGDLSTASATAKLFATEAAQRVVDNAVQLHGGSGVLVGSTVEKLYRAIRPLRIYEGSSEIQRLILGKNLTR